MWTGQQYVGGQQMMQLQLAAQQQQQQQQQQSGSSSVGAAQELYANGYQDVAATTSAAKQMASTRDRPSGTDFRLDIAVLVSVKIIFNFYEARCHSLTICGDACPLSCVSAEACLTGWPNAQGRRDGGS